jgi:Aldehyde dehydrogenase family
MATDAAGTGLIENYIAGKRAPSRSGRAQDVYNPATGRVIGRTGLSSAADVDLAVRAAKAAFPAWSQTPVGSLRCPMGPSRFLAKRRSFAAIRAKTGNPYHWLNPHTGGQATAASTASTAPFSGAPAPSSTTPAFSLCFLILTHCVY